MQATHFYVTGTIINIFPSFNLTKIVKDREYYYPNLQMKKGRLREVKQLSQEMRAGARTQF